IGHCGSTEFEPTRCHTSHPSPAGRCGTSRTGHSTTTGVSLEGASGDAVVGGDGGAPARDPLRARTAVPPLGARTGGGGGDGGQRSGIPGRSPRDPAPEERRSLSRRNPPPRREEPAAARAGPGARPHLQEGSAAALERTAEAARRGGEQVWRGDAAEV